MAKDSLLTFDKMQRTDHDTLIRVEAKVDALIADVKEMKDGTNLKLIDHEGRLKSLEKIVDETNPEVRVKQVDELVQWKHDFSLTYKVIITIASVIGAMVGFVASLLLDIFKIFT